MGIPDPDFIFIIFNLLKMYCIRNLILKNALNIFQHPPIIKVKFRFKSYARFQRLNSSKSVKTVNDCVKLLSNHLPNHYIEDGAQHAEYIVGHVLGHKTLHGVSIHTEVLQSEWEIMKSLTARRSNNEPIQYILGEWDFAGSTLKMKQPVFIPRPETEYLLDYLANDIYINNASNFLEMGCGSGAISITLLRNFPNLTAWAIDKSIDAISLTNFNAEKNCVISRLNTFNISLLSEEMDNFKHVLPSIDNRFDFIISNPPYVPSGELDNLQPEIALYEDVAALDGGLEGLDIIMRILPLCKHLLKYKGFIWLEVHIEHPSKLKEIIEMCKDYDLQYIETLLDQYDRPRFCKLQYL